MFGDERPRLNGSRVDAVSLSCPRGVPVAKVGVLLRDFPTNPPRKYLGSNVIKITLELGAVTTFVMTGVLDEEPGLLELTRPDTDTRQFRFSNERGSAQLVSEIARISEITSFVYEHPVFWAGG